MERTKERMWRVHKGIKANNFPVSTYPARRILLEGYSHSSHSIHRHFPNWLKCFKGRFLYSSVWIHAIFVLDGAFLLFFTALFSWMNGWKKMLSQHDWRCFTGSEVAYFIQKFISDFLMFPWRLSMETCWTLTSLQKYYFCKVLLEKVMWQWSYYPKLLEIVLSRPICWLLSIKK